MIEEKPNGQLPAMFVSAPQASTPIVLYHRNHLPSTMSAPAPEQFLVQKKIVTETSQLAIDLENPEFVKLRLHTDAINGLTMFNQNPDPVWRQAVVECARKLCASVPPILVTVLSSPFVLKADDIGLCEQKTKHLSDEDKNDLREYGLILWKKSCATTSDLDIAECTLLAKIFGIIFPQKAVNWDDERINDKVFCLVEKSNGRIMLHKRKSLHRHDRPGAVWILRYHNKEFTSSNPADLQFETPIDPEHFRLANLYETIASSPPSNRSQACLRSDSRSLLTSTCARRTNKNSIFMHLQPSVVQGFPCRVLLGAGRQSEVQRTCAGRRVSGGARVPGSWTRHPADRAPDR